MCDFANTLRCLFRHRKAATGTRPATRTMFEGELANLDQPVFLRAPPSDTRGPYARTLPSYEGLDNAYAQRSTPSSSSYPLNRALQFLRGASSGGPVPVLDSLISIIMGLSDMREATDSHMAEFRNIAQTMDELLQMISEGTEKVDCMPQDVDADENVNLRAALSEVRDIACAAASQRGRLGRLANPEMDIQRLQILQRRITAALAAHQVQSNNNIRIELGRLKLQHHGQISIIPTVVVKLPPPPAHFVGRENEVDFLVNLIVESHPARVCIRGSGGIGKSAVALAVMHDSRIRELFSDSRFFVRLDAANNADSMLATLALYLGVAGDDISQRVFDLLESPAVPHLLMLDNFESPWDSEDRTSVEAFLQHLSVLSNVTLLVTLRGVEYPSGVKWTPPSLLPLTPLDALAAQEMLWSISDQRSSEWDKLLAALDHVPLAVALVAQLAQLGEMPTVLLHRWQTERTALLARSSYPDKYSSVDISIQLSLSSPRMRQHPAATNLLRVLSLLPDGMRESELTHVLEGALPNIKATLSLLHQVSLAYKLNQTTDATVRVLSPIRAFMQSHHPVTQVLLSPLLLYYLKKAAECAEVWEKGTELIALLAPEVGNIQSMLSIALQNPPSCSVLEAVIGFGHFTYLTNIGGTGFLQTAIGSLTNGHGSMSVREIITYEARCLECLGNIHLYHSELDDAVKQYSAAIKLFQGSTGPSNLIGQGNCMKGIGHVYMQRSQMNKAVLFYSEAWKCFSAAGDHRGQANCLRVMGDLHLHNSQLDKAFAQYQQAYELFKSLQDRVGLANCLKGMGDIQLCRSRLDDAKSDYSAASELFAISGVLSGQGMCLAAQANIFLQQSELDDALQHYSSALALFKSVGALVGQANCLVGLASISIRLSEPEEAAMQYSEAFKLFRVAEDNPGQANCLKGEADLLLQKYDFDGALTQYSKALEQFVAAGSLLGQGNCLIGIGDVYLEKSELNIAWRHYSEALKVFTAADSAVGQGNCLAVLANIAVRQSQLQDATDQFTAALRLLETASDRLGQAKCYTGLGNIYMRQSKLDEAFNHYSKAVVLFGAVKEFLGQADSLKGIGDIHRQRSQLDDAVGAYTEASSLFQQAGSRVGVGNCLICLGDIHLQRYQLDAAVNQYSDAFKLFRDVGEPLGQANSLLGLANYSFLLLQLVQARIQYSDAQSLFTSAGDQVGEGNCRKGIADIHLHSGEVDNALDGYSEAFELFKEADIPIGQANCMKGIGDVFMQKSELPEAVRRYQVALELYRDAGELIGQGSCLAALGGIAVQRSELDEARTLYTEALAVFTTAEDQIGQDDCLKELSGIHEKSGS